MHWNVKEPIAPTCYCGVRAAPHGQPPAYRTDCLPRNDPLTYSGTYLREEGINEGQDIRPVYPEDTTSTGAVIIEPERGNPSHHMAVTQEVGAA